MRRRSRVAVVLAGVGLLYQSQVVTAQSAGASGADTDGSAGTGPLDIDSMPPPPDFVAHSESDWAGPIDEESVPVDEVIPEVQDGEGHGGASAR